MTLAVVGMGAMGSRMAARLRAAGHTVVTRAELASANVAVVMVPDAVALRGITPELVAAPAVIVMATVGRDAVAELRAAVPGRVVDAPVLGSIAEAEAGKLVIFAVIVIPPRLDVSERHSTKPCVRQWPEGTSGTA